MVFVKFDTRYSKVRLNMEAIEATTYEQNDIGWVPSCDDETYTREAEACANQIAAGIMPDLPNGFSLVFDPVRRPRHFNGVISVEQHAWHIARRQVCISRPGTAIYGHDVTHIPGYQRMLGHVLYADLVQLAAFNSLGSPELCDEFTDAQDHFADQMAYLYTDDGFNQLARFSKIRQYLGTLVRLAYMNAGYDQTEARAHRLAAFDGLYKCFELAEYEHWYATMYDRYPVL